MIPDSTHRPASRASRGLARFTAGLALVAVIAACSSDTDEVPTSGPAPTVNPSAEVSEAFRQPSSAATPSRSASKVSSAKPTAIQRTGSVGVGSTLRIPRIGVNAPIVPIQTNKRRVLEPPQDPSVAGWWSQGAAPGEGSGSAVLVGHTVRNHGGGVFDEMGDLARGDAIKVEGSDSTLTYRVQSIDVLSKDDVAREAAEIFAQTGPGRLVLITCDDWDGKAWRSNIVTIAAPV